MGELKVLFPGYGTIMEKDLPRLQELDDDFVDIIRCHSHDKVQKRLCEEILRLRLIVNGKLDITPDEEPPTYA